MNQKKQPGDRSSNQSQIEYELREWLRKLEAIEQKIKAKTGSEEPLQKLKILTEFVREQIPHENTDHTNSKTR